jgi:membrane protein implicated in regulation of membrane protease activity
MDSGEIIYISSRLVLGALTAFFAIMLWSGTRDAAWMLMVIGTIAAYVETIYSILMMFGITKTMTVTVGSVPLASIVLPNLPTVFILSAFLVMVFRKYRKKYK